MSGGARKLTPEQIQEILDHYRLPLSEGGLAIEEIAELYGVHVRTINHHTRQNHVTRPRSPHRKIRKEGCYLLPVEGEIRPVSVPSACRPGTPSGEGR